MGGKTEINRSRRKEEVRRERRRKIRALRTAGSLRKCIFKGFFWTVWIAVILQVMLRVVQVTRSRSSWLSVGLHE